MAVSNSGIYLTMTATGDAMAFPPRMGRKVVGMTFQGTSLTAGQRLIVRDTGTAGTGNILADYQVEAATDNADLWNARYPQIVAGLSIDSGTIAGTWVLLITVEP